MKTAAFKCVNAEREDKEKKKEAGILIFSEKQKLVLLAARC